MSNVYGKDLLDLIKTEELEEKNRLLREETERKKKLLELEKQKKRQHPLDKKKERSNSSEEAVLKAKIPKKILVDPQRPAFLTITEPFQSYRNYLENLSHFLVLPLDSEGIECLHYS